MMKLYKCRFNGHCSLNNSKRRKPLSKCSKQNRRKVNRHNFFNERVRPERNEIEKNDERNSFSQSVLQIQLTKIDESTSAIQIGSQANSNFGS